MTGSQWIGNHNNFCWVKIFKVVVASLVDTDILSYYFKQDPQIVRAVAQYLSGFDQLNISLVTYYEVVAGLKFKRAQQQLKLFEDFVRDHHVINITRRSVIISGEIYASLRWKGIIIGTSDTLIAGMAIENNLSLVTNNKRHFELIDGLKIDNWKQ
jgi:tRNA(fMet)-specific endonuclease VapC